MGRGVVAVGFSLLTAGCMPPAVGTTVDPDVAVRLPALRTALGAAHGESTTTLVLHYDVDGADGRWTDDVVLAGDRFVERRERIEGAHGTRAGSESIGGRRADTRPLTFGEDATGAFLRAGDGPWRAADGSWRSEARTRRALFGAELLSPRPGDDAELVGRHGNGWEYSFRPDGGRTITYVVDGRSGMPTSFDYGDGFGRLLVCDDVRWTRIAGRPVLRSARCYTATSDHGHAFRFSLRAHEEPTAMPELAQVAAWRGVSIPMTATQTYPLAGTGRSALVPVTLGDSSNAPERFIVDTGAWWTTIDEDVALRDGVVRTGEVPIYQTPPWLPQGDAWVGVADHLRVAGADYVGVRVLVMPGLARGGGSAGLLGANVLSQMVVDFDTPRHELRFVPEDQFHAGEQAFAFAIQPHSGRGVTMPGAVLGLGRGDVLLDTGASTTMVVFGNGVAAAYPRHRGSDARFGANDDAVSPDYWTTIDGAQLGPFALPAMRVAARDRELQNAPRDLALVGMGVMRLFRVAFDFRRQELYLWPSDAYHALSRSGLEVTDAHGDGARITNVARLTPADDARLRDDDRVVAIDDVPVYDADAVRRALADHRGASTRVQVIRDGRPMEVAVALEPRQGDCTGPGDPFCPRDGLALALYDHDAPR